MTSVVCKTWVPIQMPTGETHEVEFFITKLDKRYLVVLRYNLLVQHNLAINWIKTKVIFRKPLVTPKNNKPAPTKINICQVSAKKTKETFMRARIHYIFCIKIIRLTILQLLHQPDKHEVSRTREWYHRFPTRISRIRRCILGRESKHTTTSLAI